MKSSLFKRLILPALFLVGGIMYGQTVTGSVSDADGVLPSVSVNVKGTTVGVETDFDGNYSIAAKSGDVLVFSYLGYKTAERTVGSETVINVTLEQDAESLDEVVVIGYGSSAKKEITSAVTQVGEEEFNQGVVNAPSQLLQGKVAGLSIYNKGGNPNENAVIRIRGISTVGANQSPLVVVDGAIGASLDNIDPNDIQSMTVLKDGSAAAIYGSRGSSGVIIVTTKRGKAGVTHVSYSGQIASASIARSVDIMTGDEFVAAGGTDLGSRTDWLKEVTRTAVSTIHNVAVSGGTDNVTFRVSTNFRESQGVLNKSGFDQFNSRANLKTAFLDDKLKVDFNTSYTKRDSDFSFNEGLRYATLYNPTAPIYQANSKFNLPFPYRASDFGGYAESLGLFDSFNPVSLINQNSNTGERSEFIYSANFKYLLSDAITINASYSQQSKVYTNKEYYAPTSHFRGNATNLQRKGLARLNTGEDKFKLFEIYGDYKKTFSDNFDFKLTAGYSWQQITSSNYFISTGDFPDSSIDYIHALEYSGDINNLGQIGLDSNHSPDEKIIGFFARANATLYDGIYVNASIRREGSTKLGINNKLGYFPSVGLGVDLTKFMTLDNVDLFKIRLGYGSTGALPSGNGLSQNGYIPSDNKEVENRVRAANEKLTWEKKAETNLGFEYASGSFSGTLDLYNRKVTDLFLSVEVDVTKFAGASTQIQNVADISTKGLELSLNYDVIKKEDVTYSTGIVFSTYKTILDKYPGIGANDGILRGNMGAPGQNGTNVVYLKEGEEIGQIYGALFTGEVKNGSQVFADINGDGDTSDSQNSQVNGNIGTKGDLTKLGKGIPDFELGWRNQVTYKNWDFNVFFRGAFGHSLVNTFRVFYEPRVGTQGSYNFVNTSLANPAIKNAKFSSLYVEKADFVKLDNLSIGYNLDITESNKYFKSVRLSLSGQNLFTITNYTGTDPEPSLSDRGPLDNGGFYSADPADPLVPGIDRRDNYFLARTITFGININF